MMDGYGGGGGPTLLAHPDREAASALPAIEDLFRAVSRKVRTRLVNRAGTDIPVRLGIAQITTIGQILDDPETRDGGVFAMLRFEPLGMPGLAVIQGRLLSRLVGVLLGEDPNAEPPPYRARQVTEVEVRIARRICNDVMGGLEDCWPPGKLARIDVKGLGPNPRLAEGLAQSTPVVAASLDFGKPDDPFGLMVVAIPAQATRDLRVDKIEAVSRSKSSDRRTDMASVMPLNLALVAELARVRIPLSQLKDLAVGDHLQLGRRKDALIRINGRPVITGEAGVFGGFNSIRVTRRIQRNKD
jgi:flagellar motor switch protein FliM